MAVQGLLCGFADPQNIKSNVVLIGRGDVYVLLVDGKALETTYPDMGHAQVTFRKVAYGHCDPHWLSVSEVRSNNVNDISEVVQTGNVRYDERYPPGLKDEDSTRSGVVFEGGDKVLVISEQRLATVLDVYGDGVNGEHGDIRLDLCGNTSITDIEMYDPEKHAQFDQTFLPIKKEWKEFYGITKDIPLRDE